MAAIQRVRQRRARRALACPHLGLASDPLTRDSLPNSEHRCYFQMQRERIDLAHQQDFCLSGGHRRCPWLAAAPLPVKEPPWAGALERLRWGAGAVQDRFLEPLVTRLAAPGGRLRVSGARARAHLLLAWISPHVGRAGVWAAGWASTAVRWLVHAVRQGARWAAPRAEAVARALISRWPRFAAVSRSVVRRLGGWGRAGAGWLWVKLVRASRWLGLELVAWSRWLWQRRPRLVPRTAATAAEAPIEAAAAASPPSALLLEPDVASGDLLARGVAALEADREELAYALFAQACRRTPRDARAWFWLAKTAPSLDEVIAALEQAARLAPGNDQVRVNLKWARARRERERAARALAEPSPELPRQRRSPSRAAAFARALTTLAAGTAGVLASLACFGVGVVWIAGALPEQAVAQLDSGAVQLVRLMPSLDLAVVGVLVSLVPGPGLAVETSGWPVLSALPYVLGFLALVAAAGLMGREGWARWWAPLVALGSLALWLYASEVGLPPQILVGLVTLTALAPLAPARS